MNWLRRLPLLPLAILALAVGLAPFHPEPHLVEKVRRLLTGQLHRPIDIFDLLFHALPVLLFLLRLAAGFGRPSR